MKVYLRSDPWETLKTIEPIAPGFAEAWDIDGRGSPQVLLPYNGKQTPRLAGLLLPAAGFPFEHNNEVYQSYHLPTTSVPGRLRQNVGADLNINGAAYSILQTGMLGRPQGGEEDDKIVVNRQAWIEWQIQRYMELADPSIKSEEFECVFRDKHVRRSWNSVRSEWIRDETSELRVSLIVKLSDDEVLLTALDKITVSPRRILERYWQDTPISRIQEFDSACLRDFARRPGRNFKEKAGSKQALLAVRRRERIDTLENQVTRWTIRQMKVLANDWLLQHDKYTRDSNQRVLKVRKLAMLLRNWDNRETFSNVPTLTRHPTGPNYPLQFEQRYARVWLAYVKIRQETKVNDEAWTWQRAMWSETGRQIFHSILTGRWEESGTSTPTFRPEGLCGNWLLPFRSPGPFSTKAGPALLFDSLDVHDAGLVGIWMEEEQFEFAHSIGRCGCEQVLWFPQKKKGIAIWYAMIEPGRASLKKVTRDVRRSLDHTLGNCSPENNWVGLVIAALTPDETMHKDEVDISQNQERNSFGVLIPMDAHHHADDVEAGIKLAIEALEGAV